LLVDTALRETYEELEIPTENIEILGQLDRPEYSLGNRSRVWPIVVGRRSIFSFDVRLVKGFVHATKPPWPTSAGALPSLPLSSLKPSPDEVAGIIPFPIAALQDGNRQRLHHFRADTRKPYWKYRAGDLIQLNERSSSWETKDGMDAPEKDIEVWGLTGWILNRLAFTLGWTTPPPMGKYDN
jgi:8-oxo-dGTP pyrophosphatase MutT (NUDIX family)